MKFKLENLGPLKKADFELADLTVICGKNNTGKTYLTYSLYSFLKFINKNLMVPIKEENFEQLMQKAQTNINLEEYIDIYIKETKEICSRFLKNLPRFLAVNPSRLKKASFDVDVDHEWVQNSLTNSTYNSATAVNLHVQITETCLIQSRRKIGSLETEIKLINKSEVLPGRDAIRAALDALLARAFTMLWDEKYFSIDRAKNSVFPSLFPLPFIITCERTGAALFRTELLIGSELFTEKEINSPSRQQLANKYESRGFQFPVSQDLNFAVRLQELESQQSFIAKDHPEIINLFNEIIGGTYTLKDNNVKFSPSGSKESLGLAESSSTVRSLMALNYYLKHKARLGQMLMFEEPELNLHPDNQRKIARLLVMLVNAGIKVLINTHSDYIIREFNILIMLNSAKKKLKDLIKEYGYDDEQFIDAKQVKCYVTAGGEVKPMDVNDEYGIEVTSFDDSIHAINLLHNRILFGK